MPSERIEVEWRHGLTNHVRFDPCGITCDGPPDYPADKGGVLTLRLTRDAGLNLVVWWAPLYHVGQALNRALWWCGEHRERIRSRPCRLVLWGIRRNSRQVGSPGDLAWARLLRDLAKARRGS